MTWVFVAVKDWSDRFTRQRTESGLKRSWPAPNCAKARKGTSGQTLREWNATNEVEPGGTDACANKKNNNHNTCVSHCYLNFGSEVISLCLCVVKGLRWWVLSTVSSRTVVFVFFVRIHSKLNRVENNDNDKKKKKRSRSTNRQIWRGQLIQQCGHYNQGRAKTETEFEGTHEVVDVAEVAKKENDLSGSQKDRH